MQSAPSRAPTTIMMKAPTDERYIALQRKLEQLEKVHKEDKSSVRIAICTTIITVLSPTTTEQLQGKLLNYQSEVARQSSELASLKAELAMAHRANMDLVTQREKTKKHADVLDTRAQDARRDTSELKDLRAKLQRTEAERAQLAAKCSDAGDARRELRALDARRKEEAAVAEVRRKEEVRERERRTAELERALAAEKKRREVAEARVMGAKARAEGAADKVRDEARALEEALGGALAEGVKVQEELQGAVAREEALLARLEACEAALVRAAGAAGACAAASVPRGAHEQLKEDCLALEQRCFRLERKLANAEAQVVELAQLIRQAQESRAFALEHLAEAEAERDHYVTAYGDLASSSFSEALDPESLIDLFAAHLDALGLDKACAESAAGTYRGLAHFYFLLNRELMFAYGGALDELSNEQAQLSTQKKALEKEIVGRSALNKELQGAHDQLTAARHEREDADVRLRDARADVLELREKANALERAKIAEERAGAAAMRREKEAAQKFAAAAQMHKAAEDALRGEIEMCACPHVPCSRSRKS
jgi:hypothetical protein